MTIYALGLIGQCLSIVKRPVPIIDNQPINNRCTYSFEGLIYDRDSNKFSGIYLAYLMVT